MEKESKASKSGSSSNHNHHVQKGKHSIWTMLDGTKERKRCEDVPMILIAIEDHLIPDSFL